MEEAGTTNQMDGLRQQAAHSILALALRHVLLAVVRHAAWAAALPTRLQAADCPFARFARNACARTRRRASAKWHNDVAASGAALAVGFVAVE